MFFIRNLIISYLKIIFLELEGAGGLSSEGEKEQKTGEKNKGRLSGERELALLKKISNGEIHYLGDDKEVDLNNINLDGKLTKSEIEEAKKLQNYNQDKLDILFNMQDRMKDFINSEYRNANINFLKSRGKSIENAQTKLNEKLGAKIAKDNIFGKETFLTIIRFQKEKGLGVDGLIGPKTYKKLFSKDSKTEKGEKKLNIKKQNKRIELDGTELIASNEALSGQKIVKRAEIAVEKRQVLGATNCTDWVSKIWGKDVNKSPWVYKGNIGRGKEGTGLVPLKYASKKVIDNIQPSNHLLLDKPPYGTGRTHSVIPITKPVDGLVKVASYPGSGFPKEEIYDLYSKGRGDKDAKVARIHKIV